MEEKIKFIDTLNIEKQGDSIEYSDKEYTINDCVLIRTTDFFPKDKIIETPQNANAYGFGRSNILGPSIQKILSQKYPKYFSNEEEAIKYSKELSEFDVCFEVCRRTIHFTLNGLVSSHAYGNFEGRPFVIIEPLKYHLDESLKCLRVEDVYFDNDMSLSNDCVILLEENYVRENQNNLELMNQLQNFNVYVYKGNQHIAVSEVLKDLGYDSFLLESNGYVNGLNTGMAAATMWKYVNNFAIENNISLDRHFNSQINLEDVIRRNEKSEEIDRKHLEYILNNSDISSELSDKIKMLIEVKYDVEPLIDELINQIGLDKIKQLTKEFNNNYIQKLKNSKTINK